MKSLVVVLFVEVNFSRSFGGMGGLNVADVKRKRIPSLWSTVRESGRRSRSYKPKQELRTTRLP